jgi:hypothetical protein
MHAFYISRKRPIEFADLFLQQANEFLSARDFAGPLATPAAARFPALLAKRNSQRTLQRARLI